MCVFSDQRLRVDFVQGGGKVERDYKGKTETADRCANCGFIGFSAPKQSVLDTYFQTEWRQNAEGWFNVETDFAKWRRSERADTVLRLASEFAPGVGHVFHELHCGFGGTIFELQSQGIQASGSDIDVSAIEAGKEYGVLDTHGGRDVDVIASLPSKPDVVFGFHALDRVADPEDYLTGLADSLGDDAILILTVPNAMAIYPLVYGYAHYEWCSFPDHLHYFTARSLQCLAERTGWQILSIQSAIFDVATELSHAALSARDDSDIAKSLRRHAVETSLIGEELEVVLARPAMAARFPEHAIVARHICKRSALFEVDQRKRGEYVHMPDPWAK